MTGYVSPTYRFFTTPARKLTHRMKFEHVWMTQILGMPQFFATLGQRNAKNQTQKDMNFGNATILCHFRPEKHQKSDPERHKFGNTTILWHFRPEKRQNPTQKKHEFRECHNSLLPWARESPNPTTKDMNFAQNCTH